MWCLSSATGVLKGFDALLNVVLDNTTEYLRGNGLQSLLLLNDACISHNFTIVLVSLRAGSHFRCYNRCGTSGEAASYE